MKSNTLHLYFLTLIFFISTNISAQDSFRWNLDLSDNHFINDIIHIKDKGHFLIGIKSGAGAQDQGFVIHLDESGQIKWSKIVSNPDLGTSFAQIKQSTGNNLLIAGTIYGNELAGRNCLMISLDFDGNPNWMNTIGTDQVETFRSFSSKQDISIVMDVLDATTNNNWLVGILNPDGTLKKSSQYKLAEQESSGYIGHIELLGYWVGGTSNSFSTEGDVLISHYDSNAQIIWSRWIDLPHQQTFENGIVGGDGSFYGSSTDDDPNNPGSILFKISKDGVLLWIKRLPFFRYGELSLIGSELHLLDRAMVRARFNSSDGEWLGGTRFWKIGNETTRGSFADADGVSIVGYIDLDDQRFPHAIWSSSKSLVCDITDNMYTVINLDNVTLRNSPTNTENGNLQVKSTGMILEDFSLSFTNQCPTSAINTQSTLNLRLFPNPATDHLVLQFDDQVTAQRVDLINSQGYTLGTQVNVRSGAEIDISRIPNGNYFIKIHQQDRFMVKKWVKW